MDEEDHNSSSAHTGDSEQVLDFETQNRLQFSAMMSLKPSQTEKLGQQKEAVKLLYMLNPLQTKNLCLQI